MRCNAYVRISIYIYNMNKYIKKSVIWNDIEAKMKSTSFYNNLFYTHDCVLYVRTFMYHNNNDVIFIRNSFFFLLLSFYYNKQKNEKLKKKWNVFFSFTLWSFHDHRKYYKSGNTFSPLHSASAREVKKKHYYIKHHLQTKIHIIYIYFFYISNRKKRVLQ